MHRYAVNRAHRYMESVFGSLTSEKPVCVPYQIKHMTSLNHDFNILVAVACRATTMPCCNIPLHPLNLLSIRQVYFHSNAANHSAKPPCLILICVPILSHTKCTCADWPRSARVSLTRFNKIATQGAPQMAVDKEANSLSRVYSYYSKFNLCLFYV